MYVCHIVQTTAPGRITAGIATAQGRRQQTPRSSRGLCSAAADRHQGPSADVIYMQPPAGATQAPDALTPCPEPASSTALTPWLRQLAVLVRSSSSSKSLQQQPRLRAVATRCSHKEASVTVLPVSPARTAGSSMWQQAAAALEGSSLSGAGVTEFSSDPNFPDPTAAAAGAGTPTTVPTGAVLAPDVTHSLALRDPSQVAQRPQPGQLGFRPISGSNTLTNMGRRDLQGPKAAAGAPVVLPADAPAVALAAAAAAAGTASSKALGPFGFLQWGNSISNNSGSSVYWGSPIGGTLYINPSLDDAAAAAQDPVMQLPAEPARTAAATANGSSSGSSIASSDVRKGSRANKLSFLPQWDTSSSSWGSPIGGTLYINPSVDDVAPPQENTVVQLPDEPTAATGAAAAAMSTSSSSSSTLPRVPKGSKTSKLPFLPPFKWGNPSTTQWGSPMGGTLYINPQAPADWQDGWGSGFGSSSGSSGGGSGRSSSRGGASGGSIGGIGSKPGGGSYAHARAAAEANWGGVPLGMGIAKLGVALMAAFAAAAAAALFMKATPANDNNDGRTNTVTQATGSAGMTPQGRAAAAAAAAAAAGAKDLAPAAGQPVSEGGLGFHQWMVQRLQSTLDGFEAEQSMLRTEQAVLKSMGAAGASGSSAGVFGGLKRWLGSKRGDAAVATNTSSHGSGEGVQSAGGGSLAAATGAAATAANGAAATAGVAGTAGDDVAARLADIREQLESIDVLKAALSAELSEQQQLLHKAQQEQQAVQGQLAALASR